MRHWRLFEELFDMQADANRFFDDVYRRLAMFEIAMSRWDALDTLGVQQEQQAFERLSGRSIFTERTERRMVIEGTGQPPAIESRRSMRQIQVEPVQERQALPTRRQQASVDVIEHQDSVVIRAELPGLQPGDIQLSLARNTLRFSGKIQYSIPLPEGIEQNQIRAIYRDGSLEVTLPKPSRERRIEVVFADTEPEPYY